MVVLVYCADANLSWVKAVTSTLRGAEVVVHDDLPSFLETIKRPLLPSDHLALMRPSDLDELKRLVESSYYLEGMDIILVMPAELRGDHALAHHLSPRMVLTHEPELKELPGILQRMLDRKYRAWGSNKVIDKEAKGPK